MDTVFVEVLLDDCYGLRRLPRGACRTILDIGANVGLFAMAARDAFPDAVIHTYEPNPDAVDSLREHARQVGAVVHGEAVGASAGQVSLVPHDDSVQVRTAASEGGAIPQVAFATALERIGGHCDFVKLDCEGAEWDILEDRDSWRRVDRLAMEYHLWAGQYTHDDVREALVAIGFSIQRQFHDHPAFGVVWAERADLRNSIPKT